MAYKVRADVLGRQYWSQEFTWNNQNVIIPEGLANVAVTNIGAGLEGVKTYVFNDSGTYLGLNGSTDANGQLVYRLPQGDYNMRADYLGSQYWSGTITVIPHVENPVTISTGGGRLTMTLQKDVGQPLAGVKCYLFNEAGSYLGENAATSNSGEVSFNLANGSYQIRADYLGYQFWSEVVSVPDTLDFSFTIPHREITVSVAGHYQGSLSPIEGIKVNLFTPSGTYLGQYRMTDAQGRATFSLPLMDYQVRADYLTVQYWSEVFNGADAEIQIPEAVADVQVLQGATGAANVPVYVFNSVGGYLGINAKTDANGMINFDLPAGLYKFRADYLGSQYWSTAQLAAGQVNAVAVNTGGGSFTLTVNDQNGTPLVNVPVYVFSASGAYLGVSGHTDELGEIPFALTNGNYKFRADYLGYQFWTNVATVPDTLVSTLTIEHQEVTVAALSDDGMNQTPLVSLKCYLFTASGSYLGRSQLTDANGEVTFSLTHQDYKVRLDYLGGQYWSDVLAQGQNDLVVDHGQVDLHVTLSGMEVANAPVYLFSATGSYLGINRRTGPSGAVSFTLPAKTFKFRVDYNGTQYWSEEVNIIAHDTVEVELTLDLLALDLTNNPHSVRFDGESPVFTPAPIRLASLGTLSNFLLSSSTSSIASLTPETYFFINDHLGTPRLMVDEAGQVVWQGESLPFGETTVTGTQTNNFRFPGQYFDSETGLHYNWHRYYDPATGRYLTPDPIGLSGGINLYSYSFQNPINYFDPTGLDVWHIINSKAVAGRGHAGSIVGQGNNFTYHSFGPEHAGRPIDNGQYVEKSFSNLKDAMNYAKGLGYDLYARYPSSIETDEKARQAARRWADDKYHGTAHNCQDMVNDMMGAGEYGDLWMDPNWPNMNYLKNLPLSSEDGPIR